MEWIKVTDRLPKTEYHVLVQVYDYKSKRFAEQALCYYDSGKWIAEYTDDYENNPDMVGITHWMELPEPPNEQTITWQYSTRTDPDTWVDASDSEYEIGQHLQKYNWRQIEK